MTSNNGRTRSVEIEPLISDWEACLKELAYFKLAHIVEQAIDVQRRHHSSPEVLANLKHYANGELWTLIDKTVQLPPEFETVVRRAVESKIQSIKRSSLREKDAIDTLETVMLGAAKQPIQDLEDQEKFELLDAELQKLSDQEIRVLSMRHLKGKSVSEIAELEQVSPQTIRNRERSAYRRLRKSKTVQSLVS